jgi:transcription initiation factor TFIIH subunit 2
MGSLTSIDPGDIFSTIDECKKNKIRCSIISLAAEVHICKKISSETNGIYQVILDELHLHDVFQKIAFPLPNNVSNLKFKVYINANPIYRIYIVDLNN